MVSTKYLEKGFKILLFCATMISSLCNENPVLEGAELVTTTDRVFDDRIIYKCKQDYICVNPAIIYSQWSKFCFVLKCNENKWTQSNWCKRMCTADSNDLCNEENEEENTQKVFRTSSEKGLFDLTCNEELYLWI